MTYHVARNNRQLGAFPKEEAFSRYNSGAILPSDLVWTEGMTAWQPASQVLAQQAVPPDAGIPAPPLPPAYASPPDTGVASPMRSFPDASPPKPDNHLVWAILTTFFCCMPLGVAAIIFSAQVDGKYKAGDYQGAKASADMAKRLSIISAVSVLFVIGAYLILAGLGVVAGALGDK
ncbi:MAG: CD225/dispanin family protein [Opitutaceae bacterium]|jgi:hypothetical protein|nr:CD225/dispanin family protein [Opitutaceae bacterium]